MQVLLMPLPLAASLWTMSKEVTFISSLPGERACACGARELGELEEDLSVLSPYGSWSEQQSTLPATACTFSVASCCILSTKTQACKFAGCP